MDWTEIRIETSDEAVEAVTYFLETCGLQGVAIYDAEVLNREWDIQSGKIAGFDASDYPEQGVIISAYLSNESEVQPMIQQIQDFLQQLPTFGLDPGSQKVETRLIQREDWENTWKTYFKPIQVTEQIFIKPAWESLPANATDRLVIEMDPGLAFGTGTHPTTQQSLQLLEKYLVLKNDVIDVGCGSGILSIAAAKLGADHVLAIDIDPEAIQETKKHIALNQLDPSVIQVVSGDGLQGVSQTSDLVVANLLAELHLLLVNDLPRILRPGGMFIAAGIIEEKAEPVQEACEKVGLQLLEVQRQADWVAIAAKKW